MARSRAKSEQDQIRFLVETLNDYSNAYYNQGNSPVDDAVFDRMMEELKELEADTGIVLSNSPTQNVGYMAVSSLEKTTHLKPLLSLEKTKSIEELADFIGIQAVLLMYKLDGLTVELIYEGGKLIQASTRGNGRVGDVITHNARAIRDIPQMIPNPERLVIVGEAHIRKDDFARIQKTIVGSDGKPYKNPRNLAAGSIRVLNASVCAQRCLRFAAFSVIEGLDGEEVASKSKYAKLAVLSTYGFKVCPFRYIATPPDRDFLAATVEEMKEEAEQDHLPIDGMVVTYNDIAYSKSMGTTNKYYKDGRAFKFEDDIEETELLAIEWNTTRSGLISIVGILRPVELEGTTVSRVVIHNLSILKRLELRPGCRVLVSKRGTIIPHLEENLDRGSGVPVEIRETCVRCSHPTIVKMGPPRKGQPPVENLHCTNPNCPARELTGLNHFVSRKAMNIVGLSKATLERFVSQGWISTTADIFRLDRYQQEIVELDGFGQKSFDRLWTQIEAARSTTFEQFVIALDIPMIGEHASGVLAKAFDNDLDRLYLAATEPEASFLHLEGFGPTMNLSILSWFKEDENVELFYDLRSEVSIVIKQENSTVVEMQDNPFDGATVVVTGTLPSYTRSEIEYLLSQLGAKAVKSVSSKTGYLLCGDKPGSKLTKAKSLGIPVIDEEKFHAMIGK